MTTENDRRVAIIGIACRFPGAHDYAEFWHNLRSGTESITFFDDIPAYLRSNPDYVAAAGVVDGADEFDAGLFGFSPTEAGLIDPQHRVLLECAWAALEDAGRAPTKVGREAVVGVFAGAYHNHYAELLPRGDDPTDVFLNGIGTDVDYLSTRISHTLGLTGPSLSVQTACSTSLVAVHLAVQSLRAGACDLALAGGVTIRSGEEKGYVYHRGGIYSPDGHTRTFDADASGTVIGEGAGIVVLRRLTDALADGDPIRAVVLGSSTGNDGADRAGFSAPGVDGQARIVRAALRDAGVDADRVRYVETHGSGTPLGDRIEFDALARAFRAEGATGTGYCAIGSVKTNIGHTHAAAGIAGLIKTVGALEHGEFPPSLHFRTPNPRLAFQDAPFRVSAELAPWPADDGPRIAGVSSFGLGGTGAHVVLTEAPLVVPGPNAPTWQVVPLSAHDPTALDELTDRLAATLVDRPESDIADVAHTLRVGRAGLRHRRFTVTRTTTAAARALSERDPAHVFDGAVPAAPRRVAFLLPGLGEQYPGMGRDLYEQAPVFHREMDTCFTALRRAGIDLRDTVWPREATVADSGTPTVDLRTLLGRRSTVSPLDDTRYAQPAVFAIEYALARLWMSLGVRPDALLGYSVGEYVAACLAGVVTLEDALAMVAERAKLISELPPGAMLAVSLSEQDVTDLLPDGVSLSAVNGPELCVVAGPIEVVDELRRKLDSDGVPHRYLRTTHAFHSSMMEPLVDRMTELAARTQLRPPTVPLLSTVTGDWISDADATDPGYWARHLCRPVRFFDGVRQLWTPGRITVEVGPGQSLSSLAMGARTDDVDPATLVLASLPASYASQSATAALLTAAGKLWLGGVPVDWSAWYANHGRRVPLPTYAFQRTSYTPAGRRAVSRTTPAQRSDSADWCYLPEWVDAPVTAERRATGRWWLFTNGGEPGDAFARRLAERGTVLRIGIGDRFEWTGPRRCVIRPDSEADHAALVAAAGLPTHVVHQWLVGGPDDVDQVLRRGFHSLVALAKAIGRAQTDEHVDVTVVSTNLHGSEPTKATVLGPCRVWPQENAAVTCRSVDLNGHAVRGARLRATLDQLLIELDAAPDDHVVAYRGGRRRCRVFRRASLDQSAGTAWARPGGVYLITGGLGGVGLALARHLARTAGAKLVLTSRLGLPDKSTWDSVDHDAETRRRIRGVREIEALGGETLVCAADVNDVDRMRAVLDMAKRRFGPVNGVVHAAGVPGAGLIQLKDPAGAARVLAPKVHGTLALLASCASTDLDFLLLCSSGLAVTGGVGQVDYVAANAFLDAVAHHHDATGDTPTVSVNWDAWRGAGMAERMINTRGRPEHPWIDRCVVDRADIAVYAASFEAANSWLVDEHRMLGRPVVPGVAHLELVRAAFAHHRRHDAELALQDVTFYSPIVLREDERKEVRVVLRADSGRTRYAVVGRAAAAPTAHWQLHSTGEITELDEPRPPRIDPAPLTARLTDLGLPEHDGPMGFGARSRNLRRMYAGEQEYLAEIELAAEFHGEVADLPLHPALLDIATAFPGLHVAREFRIPLSYRRIRIYGGLTPAIVSHQRTEVDRAGKQTITADVTITDPRGHILVVAEGFVLKKADDLDRRLTQAEEGASDDLAYYTFPDGIDPDAITTDSVPEFLADALADGLDTDEGVAVFDRVLRLGVTPQVLVTTKDLDAVMAKADARATRPAPEAPATGHRRPALSTPYVAPRNATESTLTELWQQVLGVDHVGVHDPFVELGGHSLLGLRLLAGLRKAFAMDVPVGAFFDATTVAAQADVVNQVRST